MRIVYLFVYKIKNIFYKKTKKTPKQPACGEEAQGTSYPVPAKKTKKAHHTSEAPQNAQSEAALAREELKCHKVIEKAIQKAIKEASFREVAHQCPQSGPLPDPTSTAGPAPPPQAATPALSPDGDPALATGQGEVNVVLFGAQSGASTPRHIPPASQGDTAVEAIPDQDPGPSRPEPLITPDLASYIQEAIRKGIRQELLHRTTSWVSDQADSQVDVEGSIISSDQALVQDRRDQATGQATAPSSASSGQESLAGVDLREQDMSEDEDLAPDQPSFMALFKPQLFCSLLHEAKSTTGLGISRPSAPNLREGVSSSVPLFEDPTIEMEENPGPKLLRDVLQRQWSSPASGPSPNSVDRRLYNLAPELATLLQVPSVDQPVVALSTPSNLMGPPKIASVRRIGDWNIPWLDPTRPLLDMSSRPWSHHFSTGRLSFGYANFRIGCRSLTPEPSRI